MLQLTEVSIGKLRRRKHDAEEDEIFELDKPCVLRCRVCLLDETTNFCLARVRFRAFDSISKSIMR
jgi:hypothetical protein